MSSACLTLSTYAFVVASVLAVGVPTFNILFPPTSTVCDPATVTPPSKSADVLMQLEEETRVKVTMQMATIKDVSPDVVFWYGPE